MKLFRDKIIILAFALPIIISCNASSAIKEEKSMTKNNLDTHTDTATFGTGCFWCTEAVFIRLDGVISVSPGYSGGLIKNPTYKEVSKGETKYAEVIQIYYDKNKISFDELLEVFWSVHDPTTLNRQGADVGPQYRSVVFYHNANQAEKAREYKKKLNDEKVFNDLVVTEISPFTNFYEAEDYHKNYYERNPNQGYCQFVIVPKISKFEKIFEDKLKQEYQSGK